jgi:hypothetical protein
VLGSLDQLRDDKRLRLLVHNGRQRGPQLLSGVGANQVAERHRPCGRQASVVVGRVEHRHAGGGELLDALEAPGFRRQGGLEDESSQLGLRRHARCPIVVCPAN